MKNLGWIERSKEIFWAPHSDAEMLREQLRAAQALLPCPVIWLIGKTQAGKTAIIRTLTGNDTAHIGNGFQPCTRTARLYDFPPERPFVRFLDTRGLGEIAYDPAEDMRYCEEKAHLLLGVMKGTDLDQSAVFGVLRAVRKRHPEWPVLIAQTGLHEAYPGGDAHLMPYPYDQSPWPPHVPDPLRRVLMAQRQSLGKLSGDAPVHWVAIDLTQPEDGFEPVDYGVEALWLGIETITNFGLDALLRGDIALQDTYDRAAHPHIVSYAIAAAGIGALPAVDIIGVPTLQAKMLHSLSAVYDQPWDKAMRGEFLSLLGAGILSAYATRMAGRSLLKLIPGVGQTAGAVWGAAAAGATTYALGKAAGYFFYQRTRFTSVDVAELRRVYEESLRADLPFLKRVQENKSC